MNNLQLSLLLGQYLARLDEALNEVKEALPPDMVINGENLLGQPTKWYPCLDKLKDVADDLRIAVEKLSEEPSAT